MNASESNVYLLNWLAGKFVRVKPTKANTAKLDWEHSRVVCKHLLILLLLKKIPFSYYFNNFIIIIIIIILDK